MGLLAQFGIEQDGLALAVNLLLLLVFVLWAALIYWTYADAKRRIGDPMLAQCAWIASAIFPFVGTIVYVIVRPPEYLTDIHERELEVASAEARVAQLEELACPYCDFEVEKTFLRCPSCLRRLKEPCQTCGKPLDPRWKICPYCEAEIAGQAPRRRQARPSARTASAARADAGSRRETPAGSRGEAPARAEGTGARRDAAGARREPAAPAEAAAAPRRETPGRREAPAPAPSGPEPDAGNAGPATRVRPEPSREAPPRPRPTTDGVGGESRPRTP